MHPTTEVPNTSKDVLDALRTLPGKDKEKRHMAGQGAQQ